MSDRNDAPEKRKKSVWPLVIGLPLIAVIAAAAILFTSQSPERSAETPSAPSADAPREPAETPSGGGEESASGGDTPADAHPTLGDADAPVMMLEFSDYQ